jgi:hypothetical protein
LFPPSLLAIFPITLNSRFLMIAISVVAEKKEVMIMISAIMRTIFS